MLDTRSSVLPGDEIYVPIDDQGRTRAVIVKDVDAWGVNVIWFTPNGLGPFEAHLPHVALAPVLYRPEAAGQSKSYWRMTPQEIVDTDRALRKVLKLPETKPDA